MGCVYAATSALYFANGLIKIGLSSKPQPKDRLGQLSSAQPQTFKPIIWVATNAERAAETLLHHYFHPYRYEGDGGVEWFKNIPPAVLRRGFKLIGDINNTEVNLRGHKLVNGIWELAPVV